MQFSSHHLNIFKTKSTFNLPNIDWTIATVCYGLIRRVLAYFSNCIITMVLTQFIPVPTRFDNVLDQ
jgi:hypothetical protein